MTVAVELVTPLMARYLLSTAEAKSDWAPREVAHFTLEMSRGRWREELPGDPILVVGGHLADGRKRLAALDKAGKNLRLAVDWQGPRVWVSGWLEQFQNWPGRLEWLERRRSAGVIEGWEAAELIRLKEAREKGIVVVEDPNWKWEEKGDEDAGEADPG